jgi:uncharacterized membrane protein HdeD (DUF308 family)
MTGANILFVVVGAVMLLAGLAMLVTAIRGGANARPRNAVLLIAGMMAAAFGLVLGGFAIIYATAAPPDLDAAEPAR